MTDDYHARMLAHLLRALEPHGVGADRLTIAYEEDLQDYDVLISGDVLTEAQMTGVSEATRLGGCVRFTNPGNEALWHDRLNREDMALLKARAAGMREQHPDLPPFDRSTGTLSDFTRSLEVWAGLEPGSSLRVTDDRTVVVDVQEPKPDFPRFTTLMRAVDLLAEHDIEVFMTGRSVP